ncbi:MAG: 3-hydroxybutyrate dehydrogenase [Alphaproteobacteria bacterium]|nr:3-hydroxybutyrate dehydrogenase [Alphaproteobacteria bacterium]
MSQLKGKVALVTGSTSGIGLGVAKTLAAQGASIMLNGFGEAAVIDGIKTEIADEYKVPVSFNGADLSKPEQIKNLVEATVKELGSVDIIVNNAGFQHVDLVEDFPPEKWDAMVSVMLTAPFHIVRHAMPTMKKNNWGRIINIASAHGKVASAKKSCYVACKHGMLGFSKSVALETAETGITSNCICPGWVLTPLVQNQIDANAKNKGISVKQAEVELLSEKQPSKQFVTPEQIGGLAVFLCSDAAAQITGTEVSIDGGWTAQ